MKISFVKPVNPTTGIVVYTVNADGRLSGSLVKLDKKTNGAVRRAIRASRFEGKKGQGHNDQL